MGTPSVVVTDLDGTLWHTPDHVPEVTLRALADLDESSVPLLVATGRRVASTRAPLARLDWAPPAVVLNGGIGLDLVSGERFHRGGFTSEAAAAVLEVFLDGGVTPCIYVDDDVTPVWVGESPSTHPDHLAGFGVDVKTGDLRSVVADQTVLAFGVLGIPEATAEGLGSGLVGIAAPHVAPDRQYLGHAITVAPNGISKWEGIAAFCAHHDLDAGSVLAIGDGPNDVEMLAGAAVAVVPADGHEAALALADHVVAPAADGGWAELLDIIS